MLRGLLRRAAALTSRPPVGRKRKPEDSWMPPYVYRGKSKFEYRPNKHSCITLCPLTADRSAVWQAYHKASAAEDPTTFGGLLTAYLASLEFSKLGEHTRRAYTRYADQLRKVFGLMFSDEIEPADIRRWLDVRAQAKSETLANREFALMGSVFRWGRERGKCAGRPTLDVRRFVEEPRDRVVEADELAAFATHCSERLRAYLALRMVTPLRQGEIIDLPIQALRQVRAPLDDDDPGVGLPVESPSKRGRRRIFDWSPALQAAVEAVLRLEPRIRPYTWPASGGARMTQNALQNDWKRAMKKHIAAGGAPFREHDLRAAAVDELDLLHAQLVLGHQSIKTTRRHYRRRPERVKPAR